MTFTLRSDYDSTQVWVDGNLETTFPANTGKQVQNLSLPVTAEGTVSAYARAFKDEMTYDSVTKQEFVIVVIAPVYTYTNFLDNDIDADDFERKNIFWAQPGGFSNGALHTNHSYSNNSSPLAALLQPILIVPNSELSFDEVAIIEPGEPGSVYGDSDFWDYVLVEASVDGLNWIELDGAWDARNDSAWLNAYNGFNSGNSSMYRNRAIDLTQYFSSGEVINIRFRMFADAAVTAWGWAIDNVIVDTDFVAAAGDLPSARTLDQNYPNPFNPKTTIAFSLDRSGPVKLKVYDVKGHLVRTPAFTCIASTPVTSPSKRK
jgi:hypothetical protein